MSGIRKACPKCGADMTVKVNARTGRKFWGCIKFPECRGTRIIRIKRRGGYRKTFELFHGRKIKDGHDVHHIDGDSSNGSPENLMEIDKMSHRELTAAVKRWKIGSERGTVLYTEIKIMEERLKK